MPALLDAVSAARAKSWDNDDLANDLPSVASACNARSSVNAMRCVTITNHLVSRFSHGGRTGEHSSHRMATAGSSWAKQRRIGRVAGKINSRGPLDDRPLRRAQVQLRNQEATPRARPSDSLGRTRLRDAGVVRQRASQRPGVGRRLKWVSTHRARTTP